MDPRWRELTRHIELEDVAVVVMVFATQFIGGLSSFNRVDGGPTEFLGGLVSLLAAAGAVVALMTRVPGETRFEHKDGNEPQRIWMIGPFLLAIALVAGDSLDRMGLPGGDYLIVVALGAVLLSVFLADKLPVVSRNLRRLLMTPFVLLATAFFVGLASDVAAGLGGGGTVASLLTLSNAALLVQLLAILALASAPFYAALVFVPRELADPGGSTRAWLLRFAVFYVSLVVAITLGGGSPVIAA